MTTQPDYTGWIGRTEVSRPETLAPRLLDQFLATLAPHLADTGAAPAGIHWCLSPPVVPAIGLGQDGHPVKGGFLPPVPLPRRMWAGGALEFLEPLRAGDSATRSSRIADVRSKTGRSGTLCFVAVEHEIASARGIALRERHDIVYRAAAKAPAPPAAPDSREAADAEWQVDVDPVMLFRYSALTFNGHRIHYDEPYAREVEFYPGLVIHGPLQATLMLNLAVAQRGNLPKRFAFRGVNPACGPQTLRIRAWQTDTGLELATVGETDVTTMTATATW